MNLSVGRNWIVLFNIVMTALQAIVPTLKRQPGVPRFQPAVTNALVFGGSVVRVHHRDDRRQRWRAQLREQLVNMVRNAVDMIVGVDLSEARGTDVTILKFMPLHL